MYKALENVPIYENSRNVIWNLSLLIFWTENNDKKATRIKKTTICENSFPFLLLYLVYEDSLSEISHKKTMYLT